MKRLTLTWDGRRIRIGQALVAGASGIGVSIVLGGLLASGVILVYQITG